MEYQFYLVSVRYVDGFPAFGHVPDDARTPRYVYFLLLLHLLQRGHRAYVEQFGHQALGLAALEVVRGSGRGDGRLQRAHVRGPDGRPDDQPADGRLFDGRNGGRRRDGDVGGDVRWR